MGERLHLEQFHLIFSLFPFIPFDFFINNSENLIKLNKKFIAVYVLMAFMFIGFIAVLLILISIAFTISIAIKIRAIYAIKETTKK